MAASRYSVALDLAEDTITPSKGPLLRFVGALGLVIARPVSKIVSEMLVWFFDTRVLFPYTADRWNSCGFNNLAMEPRVHYPERTMIAKHEINVSIRSRYRSAALRRLAVILLLSTLCIAQIAQEPTSEAEATASLINGIRAGCDVSVKNDPADLVVPSDPEKQFAYILNGKKFSQKEWAQFAARSRIRRCSADDIQVSFSGTFPSNASATYRIQHEGTYDGTGTKLKVFGVYARLTFVYMNSRWQVRKLEAVNAR
jgi:hypothetical protein